MAVLGSVSLSTVKFLIIAAAIPVCVTAGVRVARAELAFLPNGDTLSIQGHRIEGDSLILSLRSGGEIVTGLSFVDHFEPDEVPYPDPRTIPVSASNPVAPTPATSGAPYEELIDSLSAQHGVPADLVHAVIQVESGYQQHARSRKGAMGLMQLMPETARRFDVADPYDPRQNIDGGIRYLKTLLGRFPLQVALAAYNAGEAAVQRFSGIPPYAETRDYVARILRLVHE
jgi:transglycosylase-like protein with SLT domain